ncbi:hypothetical protein [Photobacterium sp. J15]|uniref:hypothetical protein n=1 Tax=Photobacterium sp. J15 TaxID=265901 RepID=UPI0007E43466|nr:hypothetical protein [Photobacterium sp. J15]
MARIKTPDWFSEDARDYLEDKANFDLVCEKLSGLRSRNHGLLDSRLQLIIQDDILRKGVIEWLVKGDAKILRYEARLSPWQKYLFK